MTLKDIIWLWKYWNIKYTYSIFFRVESQSLIANPLANQPWTCHVKQLPCHSSSSPRTRRASIVIGVCGHWLEFEENHASSLWISHDVPWCYIYVYDRRKFRSQTSDNMDRWKAEMGRVREEKRRRKRKSQKKAPEGRKVGSLKRRARRDEKLHAVVARSTCPSQNV